MFGYFVYLVKGVELLFWVWKVLVKIIYDKGEFIGDVLMIFVVIINFVGGFE